MFLYRFAFCKEAVYKTVFPKLSFVYELTLYG